MSVQIRYQEEHALLREEARRWLAERWSLDALRRRAAGTARPGEDDASLLRELAELGWLGLRVPEAHGGAGLGATHLAVLMEECGRRLLAAPLLPALLATGLVETAADAGVRARWLPELAAGRRRAALALVEPDGAWHADATRAQLRGGRVTGEKHHVQGGGDADLLLLPVRDGRGLRFVLLDADAPGVTREPEVVLDGTRPQARVRLDEVAAPEERVLPADADAAFDAWLPQAWLALAAEGAGVADALLETTAAYARTRQQFGRAIGSFQGVKHPLVDVLIGVEQTRSLVYAAASALDAGDAEAEGLARMARAHAGDVAVSAASRAIQFHGGYGFTEECEAHLYLRRAQASRPVLGDPAWQRARIAARLAAEAASA